MLSESIVRDLAPTRLDNYRVSRYRGDEVALDLAAFASADRAIVLEMYDLLRELVVVVGDASSRARAEGEMGPVLAFAESRGLSGFAARARQLGALEVDARLSKAIHDIRGGAFTAIMLEIGRGSRATSRRNQSRALFYLARDHMKMMRSVARDLDPEARARDLAFRPHALADLANALRAFPASLGEAAVAVDVDCRAEATIAESCVECGAIDRAAYNLLNNAVRHADRPQIHAALVPIDGNLRVAIANSISESQRRELEPLVAAAGTAGGLFGGFSTTGSGYGLRIVAELVGSAYGLTSPEEVVRGGYCGASVLEDAFVTWFHWPLSGA
jgi:signal transduction histidine kinase